MPVKEHPSDVVRSAPIGIEPKWSSRESLEGPQEQPRGAALPLQKFTTRPPLARAKSSFGLLTVKPTSERF
jgi:hypothetical protein